VKNRKVEEPLVAYSSLDDRNILSLIEFIRKGINFRIFTEFVNKSPFNLNEWSSFLHISQRTMQRYQREKKTLDALQSEKFMEIVLLYKKGIEVMGTQEHFNSWLETENLALGKAKPKSLLDSTFGINLLKDELNRLQYGILA
jgi:putative toxin-antitoxin system antitoxin component (TIGR02293 family)